VKLIEAGGVVAFCHLNSFGSDIILSFGQLSIGILVGGRIEGSIIVTGFHATTSVQPPTLVAPTLEDGEFVTGLAASLWST
jgi:hypothetical protein